jgi:hypothetical protein
MCIDVPSAKQQFSVYVQYQVGVKHMLLMDQTVLSLFIIKAHYILCQLCSHFQLTVFYYYYYYYHYHYILVILSNVLFYLYY